MSLVGEDAAAGIIQGVFLISDSATDLNQEVEWSLLSNFGLSVSFLGSMLTFQMNLHDICRGASLTTEISGEEQGNTVISCKLPSISLLL